MLALGKTPPELTRFIRNLRGSSQPILAEASDGLLYVVKFANNLQGSNLLFNECIGTELYRLGGLAVPNWQPLLVNRRFMERNPHCWIESARGRFNPDSELCFGSRFLGAEDVELFEILPGSFHRRLRNRHDFWLAWLLDVCASHADARQAIFRKGARGRLEAVFIDHGHMFGGPRGDITPRSIASRHLDSRLYADVSSERIAELARSVLELEADGLWLRVRSLPAEWVNDSTERRLGECLNKLSCSRTVARLSESLMNLCATGRESKGYEFTFKSERGASVLRH